MTKIDAELARNLYKRFDKPDKIPLDLILAAIISYSIEDTSYSLVCFNRNEFVFTYHSCPLDECGRIIELTEEEIKTLVVELTVLGFKVEREKFKITIDWS